MTPLKHDPHEYGYVIFPVNGGKFHPNAKFAIVDTADTEEGFYLECLSEEEAERELLAHVNFAVADGN